MREKTQARCRIYATVGARRDLLAYLVRRLLENEANSPFVDQSVPARAIAADPFEADLSQRLPLKLLHRLFAPNNRNSLGLDLSPEPELAAFDAARVLFAGQCHLQPRPPQYTRMTCPKSCAQPNLGPRLRTHTLLCSSGRLISPSSIWASCARFWRMRWARRLRIPSVR